MKNIMMERDDEPINNAVYEFLELEDSGSGQISSTNSTGSGWRNPIIVLLLLVFLCLMSVVILVSIIPVYTRQTAWSTEQCPQVCAGLPHSSHPEAATNTSMSSDASEAANIDVQSDVEDSKILCDSSAVKDTEFQTVVWSDGCCNYEKTHTLESMFFVNDSPVCPTWAYTVYHMKGFHVAVLQLSASGHLQYESCFVFDTYIATSESQRMKTFLNKIPPRRLVLMAIHDEGITKLTVDLKRTMARFIGKSENIDRLRVRDSYAMVGYTKETNVCYPPWVTDSRRVYNDRDALPVFLNVTITSSWDCQ